jgi:hypothetical protein
MEEPYRHVNKRNMGIGRPFVLSCNCGGRNSSGLHDGSHMLRDGVAHICSFAHRWAMTAYKPTCT